MSKIRKLDPQGKPKCKVCGQHTNNPCQSIWVAEDKKCKFLKGLEDLFNELFPTN